MQVVHYHKFECTQSMLCFLHVHLIVLQLVLQLHLMTCSRCSGSGARDVWSGKKSLSRSCHLQSVRWSPATDPFHSWIYKYMYTHWLWCLAAADVGGKVCGFTWDDFKPRNADTIVSLGCRLTFHCRWSPMLSPLHLPHHVQKLNMYQAPPLVLL